MYLPLHGDERQRQLAFLSSASLSRERVVEPTAYELRILKARRQPQVHSSSGFPGQLHAQQRFNEFALTTACEALHESLGVEPELARSIEARFDEEFGSKWKCFVGTTAAFALSGVSPNPAHPHVHFSVGQLPFLLCKTTHHILLRARERQLTEQEE